VNNQDRSSHLGHVIERIVSREISEKLGGDIEGTPGDLDTHLSGRQRFVNIYLAECATDMVRCCRRSQYRNGSDGRQPVCSQECRRTTKTMSGYRHVAKATAFHEIGCRNQVSDVCRYTRFGEVALALSKPGEIESEHGVTAVSYAVCQMSYDLVRFRTSEAMGQHYSQLNLTCRVVEYSRQVTVQTIEGDCFD
jgi:hypothetical protein